MIHLKKRADKRQKKNDIFTQAIDVTTFKLCIYKDIDKGQK